MHAFWRIFAHVGKLISIEDREQEVQSLSLDPPVVSIPLLFLPTLEVFIVFPISQKKPLQHRNIQPLPCRHIGPLTHPHTAMPLHLEMPSVGEMLGMLWYLVSNFAHTLWILVCSFGLILLCSQVLRFLVGVDFRDADIDDIEIMAEAADLQFQGLAQEFEGEFAQFAQTLEFLGQELDVIFERALRFGFLPGPAGGDAPVDAVDRALVLIVFLRERNRRGFDQPLHAMA